jgi:hypothetical protein
VTAELGGRVVCVWGGGSRTRHLRRMNKGGGGGDNHTTGGEAVGKVEKEAPTENEPGWRWRRRSHNGAHVNPVLIQTRHHKPL